MSILKSANSGRDKVVKEFFDDFCSKQLASYEIVDNMNVLMETPAKGFIAKQFKDLKFDKIEIVKEREDVITMNEDEK